MSWTQPSKPAAAHRKSVVVALLVAAWAGCASDPHLVTYDRQMLAAERRLSRGDAEGAFEDFGELASRAHSDSERVEMALRQVEALRRQGRLADAEALAIRAMGAAEKLDTVLRAKIGLAQARIVLDAGEERRGRTILQRLVATFPSTPSGARAFLLIRGRLGAEDPAAFAAYCRERYEASPNSDLADSFAYEAGRVFFERNTPEADEVAAAAYRTILSRWSIRQSGVWDDAIWDLSLIEHRRGRFREEIALLERFVAERVRAAQPGSYEYANYKHAWMRIGRVYLDDLRDHARAAEWFEGFAVEFEVARIRDEALYWLAVTHERTGDTGRAEAARARLKSEFPESRYIGRPAPDTSGAPDL